MVNNNLNDSEFRERKKTYVLLTIYKPLECTLNGAKGDGRQQGSCQDGYLCLSDGTCRGKL